MDERDGDFLWGVVKEGFLCFEVFISCDGRGGAGGVVGLRCRVPKICEAPLRYERWMLSFVGLGERPFGARSGCAVVAGAKNGDALLSELNAGLSIGGLLETFGLEETLLLIQGPEDC